MSHLNKFLVHILALAFVNFNLQHITMIEGDGGGDGGVSSGTEGGRLEMSIHLSFVENLK